MSVGTILTYVAILGLFGIIYIGISYGVEKIKDKNNEMITGDEYYSSGRHDAMDAFFNAWYALPVIGVLLAVAFAIINAIREKDGVVQ